MKHFAVSVITLVALFGSTFATNPSLTEYYSLKSWGEAQSECAIYLDIPDDRLQRYLRDGYPDEPEARCLVLCVLENLRAFENGELKDYVVTQYFVPGPEDCDHAKRTEKCLFNLPKECKDDACSTAYHAFQCYYQNYGTLTHCPNYVPSYNEEDVQETLDVFDFSDVSEYTLRKLAGGCFPSGPESECFFRTYIIRYGGYTDENGPELDYLHAQTGEDAFKKNNAATQLCLNNLKKLACNKSKCEQATEVFTQCFGNTKLFHDLKNTFKHAAQERLRKHK